jgi:ABC-2 type transport system permease protein
MNVAVVRSNPAFSVRRIGAMALRYLYLLRGSWPRIAELAYWPTMQMILWGFITQFFAQNSSYVAQAFGVLLSGVLLWDVLFRGQIGVSICFLEEMWSRNLGHLFVSPLKPIEMACALSLMGLVRTVIGLFPATLLAIWFYGYSIYDLGLPLVAFFFQLIAFGWALGLALSGMVLRWGLGAESLAWIAVFALAPISGVYYPIATLPEWLQPLAWAMPSAHVFEGMRAVLIDGLVRWDLMLTATLLDLFYLLLGVLVFLHCFREARRRGLLLQIGE